MTDRSILPDNLQRILERQLTETRRVLLETQSSLLQELYVTASYEADAAALPGQTATTPLPDIKLHTNGHGKHHDDEKMSTVSPPNPPSKTAWRDTNAWKEAPELPEVPVAIEDGSMDDVPNGANTPLHKLASQKSTIQKATTWQELTQLERLTSSYFKEGTWSAGFYQFCMGFFRPPVPSESWLGDIVSGKRFEAIISTIILSNVFFIGHSANMAMDSVDGDLPASFTFIEVFYCICYTLELVLRMIVYGKTYFVSLDWTWNTFDFILVSISLQELALQAFISAQGDNFHVGFLRVLRVMKVLKLFRIIRLMRFFHELRLIWSSILGCLKTIVWAILVIAVFSFMFGVCFTQGVSIYVKDEGLSRGDTRVLLDTWGRVELSMLSLYMCTTNGADWEAKAELLLDVGWAYYGMFLMYVLFYTCVITNTLTSLFIEATMATSHQDQAYVIQEALQKKNMYVDQLKSWFGDIDEDNSGEITYEEFCEKLNDPKSLAFAHTLELELTDLKQFFQMLSEDGDKPVNLEQFVVGCIKLKGPAKSMDLMESICLQRRAISMVERAEKKHKEMELISFNRFEHLQTEVTKLQKSSFAMPLHPYSISPELEVV
eukprot:TRINITY_DN113496_c0_g1_i1.p1 TRINITY_DN113496_c0_g1~~TRINITY_DN113496_c0_g1_i1.p1  ORF type:complete len:605 (-),score=163.33 TRINITY_DN113496_c0_g1_i1:110-1924(-)